MSGSKAQREALGIPTGWKVYSAFPFAGVNQSASRTAIDDKEWYWAENFLRINDGNLRTLWDAGTAFYTAPSGRTIVYYFFYNISSQQYVAIFLSDGTAVSVAYPAATQTSIATTSNTFYVAANGQLPIATQSGSQYLIIANHNTDNDYWIWDGSILYGAGSIAPFNAAEITDGGSGYTSVPGYTVFGGSGSVVGTFVAAYIIGAINAGIVSAGINAFYTQLCFGLVIVISVVLQTLIERRIRRQSLTGR